MAIRGIICDKDGTLFDFQATWAPFARRALAALSEGEPERFRRLALALHVDPASGRIGAESVLVAGKPAMVVASVMPLLPAGTDSDAVRHSLDALAAATRPVPVPRLRETLDALQGRALRLACVTNDAESVARAQLRRGGRPAAVPGDRRLRQRCRQQARPGASGRRSRTPRPRGGRGPLHWRQRR